MARAISNGGRGQCPLSRPSPAKTRQVQVGAEKVRGGALGGMMRARTPSHPQGKAAQQAPGAREGVPITAAPTPQEARPQPEGRMPLPWSFGSTGSNHESNRGGLM